MSNEEDVQTFITKNKNQTTVTLTVSSKKKITSEKLIDILVQLVDDYCEEPEALMDDASQISIN